MRNPRPRRSYDPKLYELVREYMEDIPAHPETRNAMAEELALKILEVIDDYLREHDL